MLPIDVCSRSLQPVLQAESYDVTYREFADEHTVPPEIAADALRWWLA